MALPTSELSHVSQALDTGWLQLVKAEIDDAVRTAVARKTFSGALIAKRASCCVIGPQKSLSR